MRVRTALAVLALVGGVVAGACTPPPTGGGTTTTTVPVANCFNGTGNDLKYSGVPNVDGNLVKRSSTNGSCSGSVVPGGAPILVIAGSEPQASGDCFGLGRESAYEPISIGITAAANVWFCTDN